MGYPYVPQYYPAQPPMMDNLAQLRQQQYTPQPAPQMTAPQQSMVWVSGQQEAMGYLMAPNSAVALWDSNAPVIYLKQADASGRPTMQVFDLVERGAAKAAPAAPAVEYATKAELDALAARVDALVRSEKEDAE